MTLPWWVDERKLPCSRALLKRDRDALSQRLVITTGQQSLRRAAGTLKTWSALGRATAVALVFPRTWNAPDSPPASRRGRVVRFGHRDGAATGRR